MSNMMTTENLIPLVYSKPELWDQVNPFYSSKDMKAKAWNEIAETLNVTVSAAKVRWTNLRDLFRRELKKALKMTTETGDPEAYIPRWKNFQTMLFLKDNVLKNIDVSSMTFESSLSFYPETIGDDEIAEAEEEYFAEYSSCSSSPTNNIDIPTVPETSRRRVLDGRNVDHPSVQKKRKRQKKDETNTGLEDQSEFQSSGYSEMDGDYHFVMSILPSVRRIRQDRKTSFKMKILQLILEEENSH